MVWKQQMLSANNLDLFILFIVCHYLISIFLFKSLNTEKPEFIFKIFKEINWHIDLNFYLSAIVIFFQVYIVNARQAYTFYFNWSC